MLCSLRQGLVVTIAPSLKPAQWSVWICRRCRRTLSCLAVYNVWSLLCNSNVKHWRGSGGDTSACDKPVSLSRGGVLPNDLPRDNDGHDDHQDFDDIGDNDENISYICSLNQLRKIKNRKLRWWGPTDPKKLDMLCNLLWTLNCCFCCCCCCWTVPCTAEGAGEWSDVEVINDV